MGRYNGGSDFLKNIRLSNKSVGGFFCTFVFRLCFRYNEINKIKEVSL